MSKDEKSKRKLTQDELVRALLKETARDNHEALERLSQNKMREILQDKDKRAAIRKKLLDDTIKRNYEALKKMDD